MVERQDIDALLIGALYGELTPAEEKQLTTHLETHPGDRTALDGLTRARAALHESRILAVQLDPPQSVSALLLQEAHRRAPKAEGEGWFARFVRSFVQHPALAAAAMLVLVVGFAAIVGRSKGSMSAEHTVASPDTTVQTAGPSAPAMGDEQFVAPSATLPAADPASKSEGGRYAAGAGSAAAVGALDQGAVDSRLANTEAYKVDLAPPARDAKEQKPTEKLTDGMVVNRKAPTPKELDAPKAKGSAGRGADLVETEAKQRQELAFSGVGGAPGGPSGGESRTGAAAPPPPPAMSPPSPRPTTTVTTTQPPKPEPQPKTVKKADSDDAAAVAKDANADKKAVEAKPDAESAWARQQHQALLAAVKANDCQRAATIAVGIEQRAPGYYAANVATDRGTKDCRSYIAQRREQSEAADRAKSARSLEESPSPAKKAASSKTRAKASDKPAAAESTK